MNLSIAPSFHVEAVVSNAVVEYRTRTLSGADSNQQELESHLGERMLHFNMLTEEPSLGVDAQWQQHSPSRDVI